VVGDGDVEVVTAIAGVVKVTGDQKGTLCTKRKGDFIYVPSVQRLVTQKSLNTTAVESDEEEEEEGGDDAPDDLSPPSPRPLPTSSHIQARDSMAVAKAHRRVIKQKTANHKHKELYHMLDTTSIDSALGATLLKVSE